MPALAAVRGGRVRLKLPLTPGAGTNGLIPEGRAVDPQNPLKSVIQTDLQIVSPGYFETMRPPARAPDAT